MKKTSTVKIVLTSLPTITSARHVAEELITEKIAACVNLVPKIESIYQWKGVVEKSNEILLVIKTNQRNLRRLEKIIGEYHPYETHEFLVVAPAGGSNKYLDWIVGTLG